MLLHYRTNNFTFKLLIKHLNEHARTYLFLITKNEDIPLKVLEEILTLYFIKAEFNENCNFIMIIYRNKNYISSEVDSKKLKQIFFNYKHRVIINKETNVSEQIKNIFETKIDVSYKYNLYFDKCDYFILTRDKKKQCRLNALKNTKKINNLEKLFSIKLFKN